MQTTWLFLLLNRKIGRARIFFSEFPYSLLIKTNLHFTLLVYISVILIYTDSDEEVESLKTSKMTKHIKKEKLNFQDI